MEQNQYKPDLDELEAIRALKKRIAELEAERISLPIIRIIRMADTANGKSINALTDSLLDELEDFRAKKPLHTLVWRVLRWLWISNTNRLRLASHRLMWNWEK